MAVNTWLGPMTPNSNKFTRWREKFLEKQFSYQGDDMMSQSMCMFKSLTFDIDMNWKTFDGSLSHTLTNGMSNKYDDVKAWRTLVKTWWNYLNKFFCTMSCPLMSINIARARGIWQSPTKVYFCTWLFHIFMNSLSPLLTSVKSSIILLVLILSHSGSGWSSSFSPWRIAWEGIGRHVVLKYKI